MSKKLRDIGAFRRSVFSRSSNVPVSLEGEHFFVYNGKRFKCVNVSCIFLRRKMGELVITRKPFFFPKKKIKKKR
jgi:ribosomal protein S19